MTDKESVIEGLEHCKKSYCYRCPYVCDGLCGANCTADLASDVLDLLKEQEPVKPIRLENWWKCPSCGGNIVANMKYCPGCGRKVKWNEDMSVLLR